MFSCLIVRMKQPLFLRLAEVSKVLRGGLREEGGVCFVCVSSSSCILSLWPPHVLNYNKAFQRLAASVWQTRSGCQVIASYSIVCNDVCERESERAGGEGESESRQAWKWTICFLVFVWNSLPVYCCHKMEAECVSKSVYVCAWASHLSNGVAIRKREKDWKAGCPWRQCSVLPSNSANNGPPPVF